MLNGQSFRTVKWKKTEAESVDDMMLAKRKDSTSEK